MTNSKNTKRALLSSVLAMLVCVAMLIGSTFAWFTDSVSTGKNKIVAGNLDVDLIDAEGNSLEGKVLNFVKAEGAEDEEILWEPGCTYNLPAVSVKNNGNLALKYRIVVNGVEGDEKLLEAIEFTAKLGEEAVKLDDYVGHLEKGETSAQPLVISGHMKETAGNEYKGLTAEGISITVIATQDTVESDSFNNQYDADAEYPVVLPEGVTEESFEQNDALAYADGGYYKNVADAVAKGGTIYLKPLSITNLTNAHTSIPGNGITIFANGATFNSDLSIDTYDYSAQGKTDGIYDGIDTVNITVYNAKNLYLWGQRLSDATVNIRMVDCVNTGDGAEKQAGRTVYLTNAVGTTNIVLENARISSTDSPVYSNANGKIELRNCVFTECAVPVNINYKSTVGKQEVIIDGCSFANCGSDKSYTYGDGSMGDYAAPIRVVHSKSGSEHTVTVRNTAVIGTKGGNGDMLIVIHKGGTEEVTATLENNVTDIRVDNGSEGLVTVDAGTTATVSSQK